MALITPNTHTKDGRKMGDQGSLGSFITDLVKFVKSEGGEIREEESPLMATRPKGELIAKSGGDMPVHVTPVGTDRWMVSWVRPKFRTNTYSDTPAKTELRRSVGIGCADDLLAFCTAPQAHPEGVEVWV